MESYKHSRSSVGSNMKHIQITPKYRYKMMRQEKLKVFCRVAIEEACKKHNVMMEIINVQEDHVHMIVDVPRTMTDIKAIQIIKGLSSYLLFRICPNLRKRYPKGHFWNAGYFCDSVGNGDYSAVYKYIEDQDLHHN
jgi:putative transposase